MSLDTLRTINGIGPRAQVPSGHVLLVPSQSPGVDGAASLQQAVFTTVPAGRTFYYTVHRGDTVATVAAKHGVSAQDLRRWNGLVQDRGLKPGQQLRVTSDQAPVRAARQATRRPVQEAAPATRGGAPARAAAKREATNDAKVVRPALRTTGGASARAVRAQPAAEAPARSSSSKTHTADTIRHRTPRQP
jgi:LysM repeat protein